MRLLAPLLLLLATPLAAQTLGFDTPARYAYMKDLSSGAVLVDKNANAPIPPASMAR